MNKSAAEGMRRFGENIRRFISLEASAGLVLMGAMVFAMIVKQSLGS